jgi:hypothetical protein
VERGPRRAPSSALIGRATDLARLRTLAGAGEATAIVVTGEAGIGKSALIDAHLAELRAEGVRVLRGTADDGGWGRFAPWRRPARALGIDLPDTDPSLGPSDQEWELSALLVAGLLEASPVVVALEDLQSADVSSRAVIVSLACELVGSRVVLIGTMRDEAGRRDEWMDRLVRSADVVPLTGLADADIGLLVARLTGAVPSADQVRVLRRRTGGNPLLVRELVLAGIDHPHGGTAIGLLTSVLEGLGTATADALAVFAAADRGTPRWLRWPSQLVSLWTSCRRAWTPPRWLGWLVRDDRGDLWFRHELLAAAAVHRLGRRRGREVHRASPTPCRSPPTHTASGGYAICSPRSPSPTRPRRRPRRSSQRSGSSPLDEVATPPTCSTPRSAPAPDTAWHGTSRLGSGSLSANCAGGRATTSVPSSRSRPQRPRGRRRAPRAGRHRTAGPPPRLGHHGRGGRRTQPACHRRTTAGNRPRPGARRAGQA